MGVEGAAVSGFESSHNGIITMIISANTISIEYHPKGFFFFQCLLRDYFEPSEGNLDKR